MTALPITTQDWVNIKKLLQTIKADIDWTMSIDLAYILNNQVSLATVVTNIRTNLTSITTILNNP